MIKTAGLSTREVELSRHTDGTNRLSEKEKITLMRKYWEKFDDPIITILLIALGVNIVFTFLGHNFFGAISKRCSAFLDT